MKLAKSTLAVAVVLLAVAQVLAVDEKFEPVRRKCMETNNITEEEFMALEKDIENPEKKFKCMAHCLAEELGYLDESGKINPQKVQEDEAIVEDVLVVLETCKAEHDLEDDPCEYGYQMMRCLTKALA